MIRSLVILISMLLCWQAQTQDTPIFTDRPNVTDAVNLIAPGIFQVEMGYFQTITSQESLPSPATRFSTATAPNLSFKYGLVDWLELRLLTSYQVNRTVLDGLPDNRSDGLTPFIFSPKFSLFKQTGVLPDISLASAFTIPANGAGTFNADFNLGLTLLLQYAFDKLSIAGSTGTDFGDSSGSLERDYRYTLVGGYSITDKLGSFLEIYGFFNNSDTWFDAGFSYLVSNDLSIDIIYDRNITGLNMQSFGFGFAWKTDLRKGMN